jgi:hypothetical protein
LILVLEVESSAAATVRSVATREDLHRKVDALSEAQVERARIIVVDDVDKETSVHRSLLAMASSG